MYLHYNKHEAKTYEINLTYIFTNYIHQGSLQINHYNNFYKKIFKKHNQVLKLKNKKMTAIKIVREKTETIKHYFLNFK